MGEFPELLNSGQKARLIPVVADTSKEGRAASILMSTLMAVPAFAASMLNTVGQRVGTRTTIDCYTEVVLKGGPKDPKFRPDGLLVLETGRKTWTALIEAKIGRADLDAEQIQTYLQLAKSHGLDALITLSNQFTALPTHHPVRLGKGDQRGVELYHWSWMFVLTQAMLLLNDSDAVSGDQAYILSEMVRYFRHDSTGVSSFDRMNPEWPDLVSLIKSGAQPGKTSEAVQNTVASWHQETRDICLLLSRRLGHRVALKLSRAHKNNPVQRVKDDGEVLVSSQSLSATVDIPNAAAPMDIEASLIRRTISCSMRLAAPQDKKSSKARINWLVRQLTKCDYPDVLLRAHWPGRAPATQCTLAESREDPQALIGDNNNMAVHGLEVVLVRDLAGKFASRKKFVEALEDLVPAFYEHVGQFLHAWVPSPPKIEKSDPMDEAPITDSGEQRSGEAHEVQESEADGESWTNDSQHPGEHD